MMGYWAWTGKIHISNLLVASTKNFCFGIVQGMPLQSWGRMENQLQLVTLTNLAKGMRKKQLVYDIPLSPISWSQVQSRTKWLNACYYIFSEELTQFSPKCKVDYAIELIPSAQLISKKMYKILALKSIELKDYLT